MSVFGVILVLIFPHLDWINLVQMWKNADQNNSVYGHFLRSVLLHLIHLSNCLPKIFSLIILAVFSIKSIKFFLRWNENFSHNERLRQLIFPGFKAPCWMVNAASCCTMLHHVGYYSKMNVTQNEHKCFHSTIKASFSNEAHLLTIVI